MTLLEVEEKEKSMIMIAPPQRVKRPFVVEVRRAVEILLLSVTSMSKYKGGGVHP